MNATPLWYSEYKDFIEVSIEKFLSSYFALPQFFPSENFKSVIRYAFRGGKKLRAILALEFYLQLSGKKLSDIRFDADIMKLCIALEAVHAYSLVHDDLPCMDNDELRRGEPTVWKKYGETNAVLVGDLLNSLCFESLADIRDASKSQKIIKLISHAVGYYGMLGGQVEDIYYENALSELDVEKLSLLHSKKTGKLIEASILSGLILSGETANYDIFGDFGKKLGLAFQIKDDLLDVQGTPEETGKSVGGEKKGFVYLIGEEKSMKILSDYISECRFIAKHLGSEKIDFIVDYVENRSK